MCRFRQVLLLAVGLLALLHCSQICLVADHTYVTALASLSPDQRHPLSCGSPQTVPEGLPERCPDCGDHVFLRAVSSGAEAWLRTAVVLAPFGLLTPQFLTTLSQANTWVMRLEMRALPPPRFLTLTVFRL